MADKLKLWRQKLLDIGKRNKLLNFKETKRSTLKIIYPEIDELYSDILSGKVLEFPIRDDSEQETYFEGGFEEKRTKGSILSSKKGSEQNKSLYQLRLRSKTAIEELGTNILYLAFGFLEWTEVEFSNETIMSPILLVPVELKKESILSPHTLSLFEDDIVINPTLCYKLENDFGVKIEYDIDTDSFQLEKLFNYVSSKVSELNWRVNTDVQLGLLSFLKLNMYKDLQLNESKIKENEIIKALCGEPSEIESVPQEIAEAKDLDKLINPIDTFQVVDADSSQQQAILAAKRGISFVLQGPPGTGKSQTITNIIGECLAEGKKVLFVSEKLAALEVVYRNLQRVNLEDFCLQLHSHKARKALVVKDLSDTLNKPKTQTNGNLTDSLDDLYKEKAFLNKYSNVLHEIQQPLGKSVFQIHGEIAKYSHFPDIQYKFPSIRETSIKGVKDLVNVLIAHATCINKVGVNYKANCFFGFYRSPITFELQKDIALHLTNFIAILNKAVKIIDEVKSDFSLKEYSTIEHLPELASLLGLITFSPTCPPDWILKNGVSDILIRIQNVYQDYHTIIEKEKEVLSIYRKEILEVNAAGMLRQFTGEYSSVFRIFNSKYINDKNALKKFAKNAGHKVNYQEAVNQLKTLKQIHDLEADIVVDEAVLKDWLGEIYTGRTTDWEYLFRTFKWISEVKALYGVENLTTTIADKVCKSNAPTLAESFKQRLFEIQKDLSVELEYLCPMYDSSQYNIATENIRNVYSKFNQACQSVDRLPDWIDFINARNACIENGLLGFLDEVESNGIPINQWGGTMLKRFYLLWIDQIYEKEKVLSGFSREKFDHLVTDFQMKDISQFAIAQARIRQKLSAQRPNSAGFTSRGTEIHVLMREGEKRRKLLPIRKLFEKIPNLLLTLKPCLLMSPLSVSLFLDPDLYKFDTVIFDEASQVCTENAIGAIYRGKQLIVVGDREQLPPTNFFNASSTDGDYDIEEDDEDYNEIGAYESILDECGSIINKLPLLWHYRSRHEHLIAYSNAKIYKNLITFPTPIDNNNDLGVEFIYVPNGVYERSTNRSNKIEAKRVADIVFEHFDKYPNRSLGIVTFSEAQQSTIDNEIAIIRKAKQRYESFFDETKDESFFIKNLENVQGDERDTIIFSVGYGKDLDGKLSMFFGPLNHDGGYRRLNVAITRAKFNVKLVSSILPTDIDLTRTESRGVRMLKGYMDFAMRGMEAILGELTIPESLQFDSPFEMQVYDVLKNRGFDVDVQVGCSGYRIDLVVRHPSLSGRYVIAIECDGATYHSARTARERDRLREDVLKLRGWKIHRVWSTDWIRHRPVAVERLLAAVNAAIENYQSDEKSNVLPVVIKLEDTVDKLEQVVKYKNEMMHFDTYKPTNINLIHPDRARGGDYYIADMITKIVDAESPIHIETIYRYIATLYHREKVTIIIKRYVNNAMRMFCTGRFVVKGVFLWSNSLKTPVFRVPAAGSTPRDIKLIAPEEIAEGMKFIVGRAIGIEKTALYKEVARALGFDRTGENITSQLQIAFNILLKGESVEIKGDVVNIKST
jgi:very-short-patch-repair endonuclease/DNA polymerase III delta prime subunit